MTHEEAALGERIQSGAVPLHLCPSFDHDRDGLVSDKEINFAVANRDRGFVEVRADRLTAIVEGAGTVMPTEGSAGGGIEHNWCAYNVPGVESKACQNVGSEYHIAYGRHGDPGAPDYQPVQSSDWWAGLGMQWQGWALDRDDIARTAGFISEPFQFQFVDFHARRTIAPFDEPARGLRIWNQNQISVKTDEEPPAPKCCPDPTAEDCTAERYPCPPNTDGYDNFFGRGNVAAENSPILTLGLEGLRPILTNSPNAAPWTNVVVQDYSDWGVVVSYGHPVNGTDTELSLTFANGSPFVWAERTKGNGAFRVWAGAAAGDSFGGLEVWYNSGGVIGVTVGNGYNPFKGLATAASRAAYVVYSDAGDWSEEPATSEQATLFTNPLASRAVVAAVPHDVDLDDVNQLVEALQRLAPFAWRRICHTQVHYPPIEGSDTTATSGGMTRPLGYDRAASVIRMKLEVSTQDFRTAGAPCLAGEAGAPSLQIVFPHHRKGLVRSDWEHVDRTLKWNSVYGELLGYASNTQLRELPVFGVLPFLPSNALHTMADSGAPAEDIYDELRTWFYLAERIDNDANSPSSFVRNLGTYINVQTNTYIQSVATLIETMTIADQLAQAEDLTGDDDLGAVHCGPAPEEPCLTPRLRPKREVAAEIREVVLQSLKELIGQWAGVETTGYFQYNPKFNALYGFAQGFGSVQSFNDHHFHWGYFLRAAAAIGRYDRAWLEDYLPLIDQLRADVANYQRSDKRFPFLRNFSPFYGHHWANGVANGGGGQDQESSSEAINFSIGLIELGQVLDRQDWVDLGAYFYEEEVLAVEQYWFNQDADLRPRNLPCSSVDGPLFNGNWPSSFVHYERDGECWKTTLITNPGQAEVRRSLFFGSNQRIVGTYTIQGIPLSASRLYLSRDRQWLGETWNQLLAEIATYPASQPLSIYENLLAGIQAQLPEDGDTLDSPGWRGALARIDRLHPFFPAVNNAMAKHWAYSLGALGGLDVDVVANVPSYAAFRHSDGTRTFVAYNGSATPAEVVFRVAPVGFCSNAPSTTCRRVNGGAECGDGVCVLADGEPGAELGRMMIPAQSLATLEDGDVAPLVDRLTPPAPAEDDTRLYLRKPTAFSASCEPLAQDFDFELTHAPGDWRPIESGEIAFPQDFSLLADSLACVPQRVDTGTPTDPPDDSRVRVWSGSFSGTLRGDPRTAFTEFAIYTNNSLRPGWQQDGRKGANTLTMFVEYDFDGGDVFEPQRVEQHRNFALFFGNSFLYNSKLTPYYIQNLLLGGPGRTMQVDPSRNAPFPAEVEDGTVRIRMWGGSKEQDQLDQLFPVPVSVNAAPETNRASWIMPPYEPFDPNRPTPTVPGPTPTRTPGGPDLFWVVDGVEGATLTGISVAGTNFPLGNAPLLTDALGRFCTEAALQPTLRLDLDPSQCSNACIIGHPLDSTTEMELEATSFPMVARAGTYDLLIETRTTCEAAVPPVTLRMPDAVIYE